MAVNHPTIAKVFVLLTFVNSLALAQDRPWLNTRTKIELSAVAAAIAADCYSTASGISAHVHESNPLVSPFAGNNAGLAGACAVSFTGVAVSNKLLEHHTRLRSVLNWSVIAIGVGEAIHNARVHR